MEALRLLNIVISILKLKGLAVILGRWNPAEAREYTPEGRVDGGELHSLQEGMVGVRPPRSALWVGFMLG